MSDIFILVAKCYCRMIFYCKAKSKFINKYLEEKNEKTRVNARSFGDVCGMFR